MARQLWRGVVFACITFCMIISHAVAQGELLVGKML